jgi:hypothetical protein
VLEKDSVLGFIPRDENSLENIPRKIRIAKGNESQRRENLPERNGFSMR